MLNFTLIAPVYNEELNIEVFIESIYKQTLLPNEVIIVDWWSKDKTFEILKKFKKIKNNLKIYQLHWNIAKGRNLAIKNATNEIILCVDAWWKIDQNFCKYMIETFTTFNADAVGWNFKLLYNSDFQIKTNSILEPWSDFWKKVFNPSSRAIWFKKYVWEKIWGYPEYLSLAWEDTYFNYLIRKNKFITKFAEKAIVYWDWRDSEQSLMRQIYFYNKWDAENLIINKVIFNNSFYYFLAINIYIILLIISFFISNLLFFLSSLILVFYSIKLNNKKMKWNLLFKIKINLWKLYYLYIWFWSWLISWLHYLFFKK